MDNYPALSLVKGLNSIELLFLPPTRSVIHSLVNTAHDLQPSERFLTHILITYLAIRSMSQARVSVLVLVVVFFTLKQDAYKPRVVGNKLLPDLNGDLVLCLWCVVL